MSHRPIHHLRALSVLFVGLTAILSTGLVSLGASPAGASTIVPLPAGTISGTFSPVCGDVYIGAGENSTFIKGGDPLVLVSSPTCTVTLENLTITGGTSTSGFAGGIVNHGTLTLMNVSVSANTAFLLAGGIYNDGTMNIDNSFVSRNSGYDAPIFAGGILNAGLMTIQNSTITGNVASSAGHGGIENIGTLDIFQSTISNNSASAGTGGGILNAGSLYLSGVSITGNTASSGGGIYNDGTIATIMAGLIANNSAYGVGVGEGGGGIWNASTLTMKGSGGVGHNFATNDGGGIWNDGTATLNGITIQGNRAEGGGGIYPPGSANLVATNCQNNSVGNC